tara:strand:- start:54006 stop:54920 length:915 start_codon:yes stop_codon:yes gene_type:complete
MRIGIMGDPWDANLAILEQEVSVLQAAGGSTYWLTQVWRYDALTLIPWLAIKAPDLEFASGVVASYLRHPMTLASQALTTSLLTKGKFTLGLGLMHKPLIENMFEMSYEKPARHMREYLDILLPLLQQQEVDVTGHTVSYHGGMDVPEAPACPVLLAAMGPRMLKLCGSRTDGAVLWMTGPKTISGHILPALHQAADAAGRAPPRLAALIPVFITDDIQAARSFCAEKYAVYNEMPSYREMLDREGLTGPEDYCLIGSEEQVRERLEAFANAGATDIGLQVNGEGDSRTRTLEFIAALARERAK